MVLRPRLDLTYVDTAGDTSELLAAFFTVLVTDTEGDAFFSGDDDGWGRRLAMIDRSIDI